MGPFERRLAIVAAAGLAVRVAAAASARDFLVQGDAMVFHQVADHLADGEGFRMPFEAGPTAEHPPGWELVLAAANLVGANGYLSHRLLGAVLGTLLIVLVALLGRAVAGGAVGLTAAAVVAVHPLLWAADVSLMSETLYGCLLAAALLAAHHRRPLVLGLLLGLAALTRGEALALLPLLVVPLFWRQWRPLALAVAMFALTLAPWTIRNLTTFEKPVLISNNANGVWAGANCPAVYHGELIGSWRFQCYSAPRPGEDESEFFARQRDEGLDYLRDNAGRLPAVMVARIRRLLGIWSIEQAVYLDAAEGRLSNATRWGLPIGWLVMALAAAGAVVQRRQRRPLLVLLAPVAMVVLVALATYGSTRFRYGAEPALAVLAAVALVAAWPTFRARITQFQVKTSRTPGIRVMNRNRGQ